MAHAVRRRLPSDEAVWIEDFDDDLRFHCHLNEHMGNQLYWRGSFSWAQLRVLDRHLTADMTFVDVGANQGEFTLFAAKRLPHGQVFSFEPMTEMFDRLVRNVEANGFHNVTAVRQGLWDRATEEMIYASDVAFDDGTRNEGLGTLFPHATRTVPVETVHTTTLDDFVETQGIAGVDVVKIDIEGAELRAIRGAADTIARFGPTLIVEADHGQAEAAGVGLGELYDELAASHDIAVITRSGRLQPIDRAHLGPHQNLLCTPRCA